MAQNLRYLGPRIDWEVKLIPSQYFHAKGPVEFRSYFRMEYATFQKLADKLFTAYEDNRNSTSVGRPGHVFEWKLGICVRFYARGECLGTLKNSFGCCQKTARASIYNITRWIIYCLNTIKIDVNDVEYLQKCKMKIFEKCRIDGYAFIIDGTHFRINKTPANVPAARFFNRKGWKSITGQVVIDPFFKVVQLDVGYSGNTNDVTMYNHAPFKGILKELIEQYGEYYCCIGDNGYPLRKEMLTPYTGEEMMIDPFEEFEKEIFSRVISSVRQFVERLFGILQRKWYLITAGCEYKLEAYIDFIFAIFIIHNFMLDNERLYAFNIMDASWQFPFEAQDIESNMEELNEIRESDVLMVDGVVSELRDGEAKRDIIRKGLLRQPLNRS